MNKKYIALKISLVSTGAITYLIGSRTGGSTHGTSLLVEQLGMLIFFASVCITLANAKGCKRWFRFSAFFIPTWLLATIGITLDLAVPQIGYVLTALFLVMFFGYTIYLPATIFIVAVSYLPQRIRKRPRETTVASKDPN